MKRIRHSPEQIIRKLREADAELAKGTAIPEICKALGVADETASDCPPRHACALYFARPSHPSNNALARSFDWNSRRSGIPVTTTRCPSPCRFAAMR